MMENSGNLKKMKVVGISPVQYYLPLSDNLLDMNSLLGKMISIEYTGIINCIGCGKKTNKSFSQGYCFVCFQKSPETEECVLRPELCRAHEGFARDMEYATGHCLIDHFVYLSLTSEIKVGVTRHLQIPTRWIDQGASEAICLAKTPNRYFAGLIEVYLKKFLPDKTNWRNMLTGKNTATRTLVEVKDLCVEKLPDDLVKFNFADNTITQIEYPHLLVPAKVNSLDFEKTPKISGKLTGIKGQYLIFDNLNVLNIRKFGGYQVKMVCEA